MRTLRTFIFPAIVAASLAGCAAEIPTAAAPGQARFDGMGYGSGNAVTPIDGSTTAAASGETATADAERGGMGYGSGN